MQQGINPQTAKLYPDIYLRLGYILYNGAPPTNDSSAESIAAYRTSLGPD